MSTVAPRAQIPPPMPLPLDGTGARSVAPVVDRERESRSEQSRRPERVLPRNFIANGARSGEVMERRVRADRRTGIAEDSNRARAPFPASSPFLAQQFAQARDDAQPADDPTHQAAFLAYRRALGQAVDVIGPGGAIGLVV